MLLVVAAQLVVVVTPNAEQNLDVAAPDERASTLQKVILADRVPTNSNKSNYYEMCP